MDIYEFADIMDCELRLVRYPAQKGRWTASFYDVEVKDGSMLSSTYGDAKTPDGAISDYAAKIVGKKLVKRAYGGDKRQDFNAPEVLSHTPKHPLFDQEAK